MLNSEHKFPFLRNTAGDIENVNILEHGKLVDNATREQYKNTSAD